MKLRTSQKNVILVMHVAGMLVPLSGDEYGAVARHTCQDQTVHGNRRLADAELSTACRRISGRNGGNRGKLSQMMTDNVHSS